MDTTSSFQDTLLQKIDSGEKLDGQDLQRMIGYSSAHSTYTEEGDIAHVHTRIILKERMFMIHWQYAYVAGVYVGTLFFGQPIEITESAINTN